MNDKENAAIGANSNFGLSNSMMSSGAPSTGTGGGSSFGNAKYDSLYKMVSGCDREEGMSREELASTLGGKNTLMMYMSGCIFTNKVGKQIFVAKIRDLCWLFVWGERDICREELINLHDVPKSNSLIVPLFLGKMSKKDVDDGLEFLSNEGHIYSTTDEDHFKTTDS